MNYETMVLVNLTLRTLQTHESRFLFLFRLFLFFLELNTRSLIRKSQYMQPRKTGEICMKNSFKHPKRHFPGGEREKEKNCLVKIDLL